MFFSLLLLLGEWAYQHFHFEAVFRGCCHLCSVRSCRVFRCTLSISQLLLFSVRRVPFFRRCLTMGLTFFGKGLQGLQDGISLSGVVSLHPNVYFNSPFVRSFFAFLILFRVSIFSSRYCLCASSLVVFCILALISGRKASIHR